VWRSNTSTPPEYEVAYTTQEFSALESRPQVRSPEIIMLQNSSSEPSRSGPVAQLEATRIKLLVGMLEYLMRNPGAARYLSLHSSRFCKEHIATYL